MGYSDHAPRDARLTDEAVRVLAGAAGIEIAPERVAEVAARLRDLLAMTDDLDALDLSGAAPETVFDPSWERTA